MNLNHLKQYHFLGYVAKKGVRNSYPLFLTAVPLRLADFG